MEEYLCKFEVHVSMYKCMELEVCNTVMAEPHLIYQTTTGYHMN